MKKKQTILLCLLILLSVITSAQNTTVHFSYDSNGNRISRSLTIRKVEENGNQIDTIKTPEFISEARDYLGEVDLSIYPNPTSGKVNIALRGLGNNKALVTLVSPTGSVIKQRELSDGSSEFDLSDLPPGTYLLQLSTVEVSQTWKIIKK